MSHYNYAILPQSQQQNSLALDDFFLNKNCLVQFCEFYIKLNYVLRVHMNVLFLVY